MLPPSPTGPAVARLFHRLLALVFLVAWLSLAAQIDVLVGSRGLLPFAPWAESLRAAGLSVLDTPTIFLHAPSDAALHAGLLAGVVLAILALLGVAPRLSFALQTVLYLSYATACRGFLGFQWDNLLLECGLLAALLPRDRRADLAHLAFRLLIFKLYLESGIAKWQSPLHDWHDGSAMRFYYETAPLPTRLAFFAHALPEGFHVFESWFTLFFELAVPFLIFARRRPRLVAAAVLTGFQLVNIATANYGFFAYLALALHVFLLDETDVVALRARLVRRFPRLGRLRARARWLLQRLRVRTPGIASRVRRGVAIAGLSVYAAASLVGAIERFGSKELAADLAPALGELARFRVVNTYHLFGAITRERIEPEIEALAGSEWSGQHLFHKPGAVRRAPDFVAPHQPRVDFALWFYGLSYQRGVPPYVLALMQRVCREQGVVQGLFPAPLPPSPDAVRVAFYRYHFTTPAERRATGAWWKRERVGQTPPLPCGE